MGGVRPSGDRGAVTALLDDAPGRHNPALVPRDWCAGTEYQRRRRQRQDQRGSMQWTPPQGRRADDHGLRASGIIRDPSTAIHEQPEVGRPVLPIHREVPDPSYEPFSREPEYIEVNRGLTQGLPLAGAGAVVDLACGTGALTALVLEELGRARCDGGEAPVPGPAVQVIGVDRSAEALGLARQHLKNAAPNGDHAALLRASCDRLPLADGTVGAALMGNAIQLFDDKDRLLREVRRVLRAGGSFAFNTSFYARRVLARDGGLLPDLGPGGPPVCRRKRLRAQEAGEAGYPAAQGPCATRLLQPMALADRV